MDGPEWVGCLATNAIVVLGSAAVESPVPYYLIFHPPPSGRSRGLLLKAYAIPFVFLGL